MVGNPMLYYYTLVYRETPGTSLYSLYNHACHILYYLLLCPTKGSCTSLTNGKMTPLENQSIVETENQLKRLLLDVFIP